MNPAEQAARTFCSALFAGVDGDLATHQVTVVTFPGPQVRWLPVGDPDAIATAIRAADDRGSSDAHTAVYLSLSPRHPDTAHTTPDGRVRRGTADDVTALLGVWADLDWASPAHESGKRLPDDEAAVRRILDACGLTPTLLWRSGHGLQAYWGFAEPIVFAEHDDPAAARAAAAAVLRNWQLTLAMHAHRLGRWRIDATGDLPRVLRPAGTTNRKLAGDSRRVEIVEHEPTRLYDPSDITDHTAGEKFLREFSAMSAVPPDAPVTKVDQGAVWAMVNSPEYRARNYMPEWLDALRENEVLHDSSRLMQVWHKGHDSGDDSATDASLARHTADLGYDARDAVEIIMCYRLRVRRKLEKVNPAQRTDYTVRTVGKAFAESEKARLHREQLTAESAEAADAAPGAPPGAEIGDADDRADEVPVAAGGAERDEPPVGRPRGLGGAVAAGLDERTAAVVPDDSRAGSPDPGPRPDPGEPDPEPDPGPGPGPTPDGAEIGPAPPDPPAGDETPAGDDGPTGDQDPADAPSAGTDDRDRGDDGHDPGGHDRDPGDDGHGESPPAPDPDDDAPTPQRPITGLRASAWGARTEYVDAQLAALTLTLLGERGKTCWIWRLQQRGRGAKTERRVIWRLHRDYRWATGTVPDGYVPGRPLLGGWWPHTTFNKLAGWAKVLDTEIGLATELVKADDFDARFRMHLPRLWEPDDSGGSMATVTRDQLLNYLLDFPPLTDWSEGAQQGMPVIMQDPPPWSLGSPFTVLVRWADFGQYVRSATGVNTTPAVLTEMAELSGARAIRTVTQNGRWRAVRRDYFTDTEWTAILAGGEHAAQQREDRHGMRVVGGPA